MLHMLDTDIASYILKGKAGPEVLKKLNRLGHQEVCVSAMTRAELLFGLKKLPTKHALNVSVRKFLASVQIFDWQSDAAEFYAQIRFELERTGLPIGEMDMLIAAHAISVDAVLVTNNTRHFKRIKLPLMTENWMV